MNNTILIFDWDDTLFPTSWLKSKGIDFSNLTNIIPEDIKLELKNLDDICIIDSNSSSSLMLLLDASERLKYISLLVSELNLTNTRLVLGIKNAGPFWSNS